MHTQPVLSIIHSQYYISACEKKRQTDLRYPKDYWKVTVSSKL